MKDGLTELNVRTATAVKGPKPKGRPRKTPWDCRIVLRRIWYDFICPRSLHSLGENGREKIEGSPTNPGSPGRQSLKWVVTCGCWAGNAQPFDKQLQLGFHSIPFYWVAGLVQPCRVGQDHQQLGLVPISVAYGPVSHSRAYSLLPSWLLDCFCANFFQRGGRLASPVDLSVETATSCSDISRRKAFISSCFASIAITRMWRSTCRWQHITYPHIMTRWSLGMCRKPIIDSDLV